VRAAACSWFVAPQVRYCNPRRSPVRDGGAAAAEVVQHAEQLRRDALGLRLVSAPARGNEVCQRPARSQLLSGGRRSYRQACLQRTVTVPVSMVVCVFTR